MFPTITPDKNFRRLQRSRTISNNMKDDSTASSDSDMSSEVRMDDDVRTPCKNPTDRRRHTVAAAVQHNSPAKVFAMLKSQLQRERRHLSEVPANHPAFGSNFLPGKPHRVSDDDDDDEVFDQNGDVGRLTVRRRLSKSQGFCPLTERPVSAVREEKDVPDNNATMMASGLGSSVVRNALLPHGPDTTLDESRCRTSGADCPDSRTRAAADGPDSRTRAAADPPLCLNLPHTRVLNTGLCVKLEKLPPMSPAKLFAHIKQNEKQRRVQKGCKAAEMQQRGPLEPQDRPSSTACLQDVMEGKAPMGESRPGPGGSGPMGESRRGPGGAGPMGEAKSQGASEPAEDLQPLVMDPLLINSPSICFRKKREGVFKWPAKYSKKKSPNGNVPGPGVYLTKWKLRSNSVGLYVDGIKDNTQPWHSSVIVERLSNTVLKTTSGNTYVLVGRMVMSNGEFPQWLLKRFADGFPEDWRMLYDKFMSESLRDPGSKVDSQSVRPRKKCHAAPAPSTTRSGRMIKAPLEYWRGGRVVMDKDMNMTIHDSYETTVSLPEEVTVSPSNREDKPRSVPNASETAPLRKVKAPPPPRHRGGARGGARAKPDKQTGGRDENEPLNASQGVAGPSSHRSTSGAERRAMLQQPALHTEAAERRAMLQQQLQQPALRTEVAPESEADFRFPRQTSKSPKRRSTRERNPPVIPQKRAMQQPALHTEVAPESEADFRFPKRRSMRERKPPASLDPPDQAPDLDPPDQAPDLDPPDQAPDLDDDTWTPRRKGTKDPRPTGSKARKSINKTTSKEKDEDQWSEAEMARLKKAVNLFPNHLVGFWDSVSQMVATRTAEDCQREYMSQGVSNATTTRPKKPKTSRKKTKEPETETEPPRITARVGTLKRKQQVRQVIKNMPKEDYDDAFTDASMFNRFQFPGSVFSAGESDDSEFVFSGLEPGTPASSGFITVKTPQCHHITEDMLSVDRDNDDRSVYRLQKRMKKSRANVRPPVKVQKDIKVKHCERRRLVGEHDSFLVMETGPDSASDESGEEEDFYFDLD